MKKLILLVLFMNTNISHSQQQVTYDALKGVWSYFHITPDLFSKDRMVATEQRFVFIDTQNVDLYIKAKESEYHQDTTYNLKYSLSLRDNVPYITLFAPGSTQVLGAYIRLPYNGSLEMASDPGFTKQKQLYQRKDFLQNMDASISNHILTNNEFKNIIK